jgi:serine/threonine protein phosphatase PrpC
MSAAMPPAAFPGVELPARAVLHSPALRTARADLDFAPGAGRRYLLCSDGLHGVADAESIARVLRTAGDPDQAAKDLVALAVSGGGPDNITCIVADVVTA